MLNLILRSKRKSHRFNHLPLLPSEPGGFNRSWSYSFAETNLMRNYLSIKFVFDLSSKFFTQHFIKNVKVGFQDKITIIGSFFLIYLILEITFV